MADLGFLVWHNEICNVSKIDNTDKGVLLPFLKMHFDVWQYARKMITQN